MLGLVGTGAALDSWARARSTAVILADVACIKPMSQHVEPTVTPSKGVRSTWRGTRGRVQLQGPSLAVYWVLGDLASTGCRPFGDILAQIAGGVSSGVGVHHRCRRTLPLAELTTWRSLLLVGDPRCTTFLGAALMPVANGNLAHPRITEEDCTCSASLASQLSCPARLSRSVAAHFRRRGHELQQNLSRLEREKQVASAQPRLPGICTFFCRQPPRPGILALSMSRNVIFPVFCAPKLVRVHFFFHGRRG